MQWWVLKIFALGPNAYAGERISSKSCCFLVEICECCYATICICSFFEAMGVKSSKSNVVIAGEAIVFFSAVKIKKQKLLLLFI